VSRTDSTQKGGPGSQAAMSGRGYVVLRGQYYVLWSVLRSRYRSARIRSLGGGRVSPRRSAA